VLILVTILLAFLAIFISLAHGAPLVDEHEKAIEPARGSRRRPA
jgi:hypothetical protein